MGIIVSRGVQPTTVAQYAIPTDGSTINVAQGITHLVMDPVAAVTGLTINIPSLENDGFVLAINSTENITNLTLQTPTATIFHAVTALTSFHDASYIFRASNTSWYRLT